LSSGSTVSNVTLPTFEKEDYVNFVKSRFESLVKFDFYKENINGLCDSTITKETKEYKYEETNADTNRYKLIQQEYDRAMKALEEASTLEKAMSVYKKYYQSLSDEVIDVYAEDFEDSIQNLSKNWYTIIDKEGDVSNYPQQDKSGDTYNDITVTYLSGEEYINVGFDNPDDRRWWIPMPLRTPYLLSCARSAIADSTSMDEMVILYEQYYEAILRSVCQKIIDEYHAINFTESDGLLYNVVWEYNVGHYTFLYNGPVKEYKGASLTNFRLSPILYKPGFESGNNVMGYRSIVELFNYGLSVLKAKK
jgi:hypothetical protein